MRINVTINTKRIWALTLVAYLFCSTAFATEGMLQIGVISSYIFIAASAFFILQRGTVKFNACILSIALYLIVLFIGSIYSPADSKAMDDIIHDYIRVILLAFCLCQFIENKKDVNVVLIGLMLGGFGVAVQVLLQYGADFWVTLQKNATLGDDAIRLGSDFNNVNFIGSRTAFSACIAIYYFFFADTKKFIKALLMLILLINIVMVFASASKTALLLMLVFTISTFLIKSSKEVNFKKKVRTIALLFVIIFTTVYAIKNISAFSGVLTRLENFFQFTKGEGSENKGRFTMIIEGLKVWGNYPIFGAGTAASVYNFGYYAHNNYVELLMNSGIVGFLVFYIFQFKALVAGGRSIKRSKKIEPETLAMYSFLITIMVIGVSMVYYYNRFTMLLVTAICCYFDLHSKGGRLNGDVE